MKIPFSILIIDGGSTKEIINKGLKDLDIEIKTKFTGSVNKALSLPESGFYDLIISGYKTRDLSGTDLIKEIRRKYSDTPLFIIADPEDEKDIIKDLYNGLDFRPIASADRKTLLKLTKEKINNVKDQTGVCEGIINSDTIIRKILDSADNFGIIATDKNKVITFFSTGAEKLLGYRSEEVVGKLTPSKFHVEEELFRRAKEISEKTGKPIEGIELFAEKMADEGLDRHDWTYKKKDGSLINVELTVTPIKDVSGEIQGAFGIFYDVTEKKKLEEEFQSYRIQSSGIIAHIPEPTFAIDLEGKVIAWNQAIEDLTGVPASEILGKGNYEYSLPFYGKRKPILIDLVLAPEKEPGETEYKNILKTGNLISIETTKIEIRGKEYYVRANAAPIYDSSGSTIGAVESLVDITSLKNMENALRESEAKFRGIAERSSDIIMFTDREGNITYISPSTIKILGYEPEDMAGTGPGEFIESEDLISVLKVIENSKKGEGVEGLEIHLRKKDGSIATLDISGSPIIENGIFSGVQVIGRDITEKNKAHDRIIRLLEEQKELLDIINRSPAIAFLWKAEKNWPVEKVSKNISQFGYTVDDFTSGRVIFSSIIHPDDLERVASEVEYNSESRIDEFIQSYRILGKDKKDYWIEDFTHIVRDKTGEISHYQGIIIDITDRKKAEDELKRSSAVLKGVIESPEDVVIFALDQKYRYRVFNENHRLTMKNIWGVDIAIGKSMLDYVKNPEDRKKAKDNFDRALAGESFTVIEEYGDTALERRWYEDIYNPVTDEKGNTIGIAVFLTDITTRRQMEEELKESEYRFRELFNSMHSGVAIYRAVDNGADFVIVDFNHGAEIIENLKKEDVIGRLVTDAFPGVKEFGLLELFRKVWRTGTPEHLPTSLYRDERIMSWRENFVYRLPSGEIVAIYDDVTEAKKAERAIKASEARYHQLFESSPVSIWEEDFSEGMKYLDNLRESGISDFREYFDDHPDEILHLAGMARITDINQATLDLMKAKSKEDFILALPEIFTPESIEFFKEELITIAEGGVRFRGESTHKTLSGDEIDVILQMVVAPGYEKNTGKILISLLDITDRKKAEKALAGEKAKTEYIIDSLPGVFYIFSKTGGLTRWNKNFETLTGYSAEEIKERTALDFIDERYREQVADGINKAFSEGYAEVEAFLEAKDGKKIPIFLSAYGKIIDGTPYLLGTGLDITASKEAQQEIQKLAAIVQHSGEMISMADVEGKFTFINEAGAKMVGIDINDISKHNILDVFTADQKDKIISEVLPELKDKGSWEGDLQYINLKTGHIVDVHAMTFTIYDPETAEPQFLTNVSLDITDRKRAEEALAREKANVEYIIDSLPGMFYMFYMFDERGRFVRWNKNLETLTGYSAEEVRDMKPLEFIEDNYKEEISDSIKTAFKEGYADLEAAIVTKEGRKIPFFFSANRKVIDGTAYILGMGLDISKTKDAEREIRKLALVVRHSGELIAITSLEGTISFINEAGARMIGTDPDEISKYHFMDFIPDNLKEKMNSEVLPTMAKEGLWEGELKYINISTGDLIDVHAMTFTINDPDTNEPIYLANVSLNITDRIKAEAALKEVNKKLNLLGSITRHDILNQVTIAQGNMEILEMDGLLPKETEIGEYCGRVMGAIDTIKRQILFTKDYKDLGEQSPEWYNVGRIIDNNYRNTGFQTIKLVNETDDLEVYADPLFEKVIYNLFDNAIKHGEKITTIKFCFRKSGEDMDLICEDDGVGIPDDVKDKIFRREYYKHTGLGLFLSREILSITGLSIEENGTQGKGATFVIHIPKGLFRFNLKESKNV